MEAKAHKATVLDVMRLWRHMRPIDREEARAATRIPVLLTLLWGVLCTEVVALYADRELLALYGARKLRSHPGVGWIWMLSTSAVTHHKRDVIGACAAYVEACARRYVMLVSAVYAKNDTALRFVRRLGFSVNTSAPMVVRGATFYPIARFSCAA